MEITRIDAGLTRTGLEIRRITEAWRGKPNGARFTEALVTFLGSKPNKGTQRVYGFAITEFFNWYRGVRGVFPTPNEVKRSEAALYVKWLRERGIGLDDARLAQDPERQMDLEIYKVIKTKPESRINDIRQSLLRDPRFTTRVEFAVRGIRQSATVLTIEQDELRGDELEAFIRATGGRKPDNALDMRLACLCMHNLLRRSPTIAQIRDHQVDLGILSHEQAQISFRVDPDVFRYFVNEYTDNKGGDRSGTIATKLAALSSFWGYLVKSTAENLAAHEQLLQFNIWRDAVQNVRATAINRAKAHRESATPDRELFIRVLASTFVHSHGAGADSAAEAALEGAEVAAATAGEDLYDLRDRAILIFCYWTGIRAEELGSLRRPDVDLRTGLLPVTGKGDQTRIIRVAEPALRALIAFQQALDDKASAKYPLLFAQFLADPQAPLFPPLKLWGRAARITPTTPGALPGISPSGLARMLHGRAEQAGIERQSDDYYRMHPHGLRHLAALEANRRGVDVATIQATLGHGSLSTTGIYLEVRDPMRRSLQPDQPTPKKSREVTTFEAEAEVTPAASSPAATASPAVPRLPPAQARAEDTAAPKPKRRIVSEPRSVADAAADAATVARQAADAAKIAARAADDLAKSLASKTLEVFIEPVELPESGTTVITPPEEEMGRPTKAQLAMATSPEAVRALLAVYQNNWGQAGNRSHLATQQKDSAKGLITHAYVGKQTSLGWWAGKTGKMTGELRYTPNMTFPSMPIFSPEQFTAEFHDRHELENALADLYEQWAEDPERGFTAANSLVRWLRLAVEITDACEDAVEDRAGFWIPVDAPLVTKRTDSIAQWDKYAVARPEYQPLAQEIADLDSDVLAMRSHLTGAIVAWFKSTAWQWRPAEKSAEPIGEDWDPPNWYSEPDPLASMDEKDRSELLEWLRVLSGRPPTDKAARFQDGVTRAQVGRILEFMCQYEGEAKFSAEISDGQVKLSKAAKEAMKTWDNEIQKLVAAATQGRVKDFSYSASKVERKKDRFAAAAKRDKAKQTLQERSASGDISEDEQREEAEKIQEQHVETFKRELSAHFLWVIGALFGEDAANDPWLKTQALCTQGLPFAEGEYKEFFQVKGQTIQHGKEFASEFAKKWGQHSECLARRTARHLWEMQRFTKQSAERRGWLTDTALNAYRLYRVPCPASQEQDLRNMLGSPTRAPVSEEFERTSQKVVMRDLRIQAMQREDIEDRTRDGSKGEDIYHGRFAPEGYNENKRHGPKLPNPVKLLFAANMMRGASRR